MTPAIVTTASQMKGTIWHGLLAKPRAQQVRAIPRSPHAPHVEILGLEPPEAAAAMPRSRLPAWRLLAGPLLVDDHLEVQLQLL